MSWRKVLALAVACTQLVEHTESKEITNTDDEEDDDDFFADLEEDEADDKQSSEVSKWIKSLGEDDFEKYILSKTWVVVKFTQVWCPHCQVLTKEFVTAAKALESKKISFADVDLGKHPAMMQKFHVQGFPTIKIFYKGQMMEFLGDQIPREANMLIPYMMHLHNPSPTLKSVAKYDEFYKTRGMRVMAVVNSTKDKEAKLFKDWARRYTMHMASPAAVVTPGEVLDYINNRTISDGLLKANLTTPSVVVFPHESELTSNHSKAIRLQDMVFKDFNTLNVWILLSLPPVLHVTPYTEEALIQRQIHFHGQNAQPLITLWINEQYNRNVTKMQYAKSIVDDFQDNVKKFFLNFTFAVQNVAEIRQEMRNQVGPSEFGIDLEDGEVAVTARGGPPNMHLRWVCPTATNSTGHFDSEILSSWFEGLRDGAAERHLTSEPTPEYSGDETVRKLVRNNLVEEVSKTDKPMLLYFHAGWCSGCKQWEPTFDKIAQNASDMFSMTAAKYDIEANEQPEDFVMDRVPTLYVVHPNNKTAPVKYEKDVGFDKDMEDITTWLSSQLGMQVPVSARSEL